MRLLRNAILILSILLSHELFAEAGWQSLGDLVSVDEHGSQVILNAQHGKVRVKARQRRWRPRIAYRIAGGHGAEVTASSHLSRREWQGPVAGAGGPSRGFQWK